jgi:hypothetical protein
MTINKLAFSKSMREEKKTRKIQTKLRQKYFQADEIVNLDNGLQ